MTKLQSQVLEPSSLQTEVPLVWSDRVNSIGNGKLFGLSVLLGIVSMVGLVGYNRLFLPPVVVIKQLTPGIWVTEQVKLESVPALASTYGTVIDMRPDGEADDEPSSTVVGNAVQKSQMKFAYVPVPHGDIPDSVVDALAEQLGKAKGPTLLYCRSGRRAARTWALVEASRTAGMSASEIQAVVTASGQSAEDLDAKIKARIANRQNVTGA